MEQRGDMASSIEAHQGREPSKKREEDTRETVLSSFNSAFSLMEQAHNDGKLSDKEKWAYNAIKNAKEQSYDQGVDRYSVFFSVPGSKKPIEEHWEAIPIEGLIDFLKKQRDALPTHTPEFSNLSHIGDILWNNSKFYDSFTKRAGLRLGRVDYEAHLIAEDRKRFGHPGDEVSDWYQAADRIQRRRELILPPVTKTDEEIKTKNEPVQESDTQPQELEYPIVHVKKTSEQKDAEQKPRVLITPEPEQKPSDLEYPIVRVQSAQTEQKNRVAFEQSLDFGTPVTQSPEPDEQSAEEPAVAPESVEEIRRNFAIINRNADIEKRAREIAEEQLRDQMRQPGLRGMFKRIGLRVSEEYHRQIYIERARKSLIESNNTFADIDVVNNAVRDANRKREEEKNEGQATIDRMRAGGTIKGETVIDQVEGPLKTHLLEDILKPLVAGTVKEGDIQAKLREFVIKHQNDPHIQEVFGRNATSSGHLAEYFATDLIKTAEAVKSDLAANKYALEELDKRIDIQLGNMHWGAEGEAKMNNLTDKIVASAQRGKYRGLIANPAVVGALSSLATFGIMRGAGASAKATSLLVPGVGTAIGGIFAGIRRNRDLKIDRAAHQVERAYNKQIPEKAPRREKLEKYKYDTASINDLLEGRDQPVFGEARGLHQLIVADLSTNTNQEALMRRVAEIRSRLDFSAGEKVDLITFDSREQVQQGRLALIKGLAEAKISLKRAGMSPEEMRDMENRMLGEWGQRFIDNQEEQDTLFKNYRLRSSLTMGIFGGAAGLAAGYGVEKAIELGSYAVQKGINAISNAPVGRVKEFISSATNGTVDASLTGRTIKIPRDIESIHTETLQARGPEGLWETNRTHVHKAEWYAYNEPGAQGNEKKFHTIKKGHELILSMMNMGDSEQKGLTPPVLHVPDVLKNHQGGFAFRLPSGETVIAQADAKGNLSLDPTDKNANSVIRIFDEKTGKYSKTIQRGTFSQLVADLNAYKNLKDGDIATELTKRYDVWRLGGENGKMGTIGACVVKQDENGKNIVQYLSTIRGNGTQATEVTQIVEAPDRAGVKIQAVAETRINGQAHVEAFPSSTPDATPTKIPVIPIPFAPRLVIEKTKDNTNNQTANKSDAKPQMPGWQKTINAVHRAPIRLPYPGQDIFADDPYWQSTSERAAKPTSDQKPAAPTTDISKDEYATHFTGKQEWNGNQMTGARKPTNGMIEDKPNIETPIQEQAVTAVPLYPPQEWFEKTKQTRLPFDQMKSHAESTGTLNGDDIEVMIDSRTSRKIPYEVYANTNQGDALYIRKLSPNAPDIQYFAPNGRADLHIPANAGARINPEDRFEIEGRYYKLTDWNKFVPLNEEEIKQLTNRPQFPKTP